MQVLRDKQELADLVHRVCRAVDRADGDLLLSCYWSDAFENHGSYKGDPAGLLRHFQKKVMDPAVGPMQHVVTNLLFDVFGDVAYGEAYGEGRTVDSEGTIQRSMSRYIDRYERRQGEWRIIHRRVLLESGKPGVTSSAFLRGTRDQNDASYERQLPAQH